MRILLANLDVSISKLSDIDRCDFCGAYRASHVSINTGNSDSMGYMGVFLCKKHLAELRDGIDQAIRESK